CVTLEGDVVVFQFPRTARSGWAGGPPTLGLLQRNDPFLSPFNQKLLDSLFRGIEKLLAPADQSNALLEGAQRLFQRQIAALQLLDYFLEARHHLPVFLRERTAGIRCVCQSREPLGPADESMGRTAQSPVAPVVEAPRG